MGHHFIPTGESEPENPEHALAIRRWTRELLGLGEEIAVILSEEPCRDPGCPLTRTTVTVFETGQTRQWSFTRPKVALTRLMVQQTLATPPATRPG